MDVINLKFKVIEDFDNWLSRASYGHIDDYKFILHTIALIEAWNEIDNVQPIYEFLLYGAS